MKFPRWLRRLKICFLAFDWPWYRFAVGYWIPHGTTNGLFLYFGPITIGIDVKDDVGTESDLAKKE